MPDPLIPYTAESSHTTYYSSTYNLSRLNDGDWDSYYVYFTGVTGDIRLTLTYASITTLTRFRIKFAGFLFGGAPAPGEVRFYRGTPESGELLHTFAPVPNSTSIYDFPLVNGQGATVYTVVLTRPGTSTIMSVQELETYGVLGDDAGESADGAVSTYLANKLIDLLVRNQPLTISNRYLALLTEPPTRSDTGSTISEPAGGGYERVQITSLNMGTASGGTINNAQVITFPDATADWGTIVGVAVCDAPAGGNVLFRGSLLSSGEILAGHTPKFEVGRLSFGFTETAPLTDFARNALLSHIFGKSTMSPPSIHLAMTTDTAISRTETAATLEESTTGGYVRLPLDSTVWHAPVGGVTSNALPLAWPEATANWRDNVTMRHLVLLDAETDGNVLAWFPLLYPKAISSGDTASINAGAMRLGII